MRPLVILAAAVAVLLPLFLAIALPADAHAATRRTVRQAESYVAKRIDSTNGWGQWQCAGRRTDRPGSDLYTSFWCLVSTSRSDPQTGATVQDGSSVYRLDARPRGRWRVRVLR